MNEERGVPLIGHFGASLEEHMTALMPEVLPWFIRRFKRDTFGVGQSANFLEPGVPRVERRQYRIDEELACMMTNELTQMAERLDRDFLELGFGGGVRTRLVPGMKATCRQARGRHSDEQNTGCHHPARSETAPFQHGEPPLGSIDRERA